MAREVSFITHFKSNSKRLAKMTWLAKFWKKKLKNTLPID
jgi:hypothetical protein